MSLNEAQHDLARAYIGGAPGIFVSGIVWLAAGAVWQLRGAEAGFVALFLGGMLIHPVSSAIARLVFRAPRATEGKALEPLGIEVTIVLLAGFLLAWKLMALSADLAIAAVAVIVGARYFAFRTMYGDIAYWTLGSGIMLVGALPLLGFRIPFGNVAFLVGAIEVVASAWVLRRWRAAHRTQKY